MIRKPIITVLGHVDAGKTTYLDNVRGTTIAAKEAGAITQHIGATEVPISVITKLAGDLIKKYGFKISLSGLLFIDTPGHEAFTNLRKRGGSIADLAVLVVDLTKGIEPQTVEAIEILKTFKVPFIVAANKIDKIQHWHSYPMQPITASMNVQASDVIAELDKKIYGLVGKLFEMGFQSERFDRINDFTKQIPIVPVSAKTGEGIPETLMFLAGLSQKYLEKKLTINVSGPGKATVLEVKDERGLGKTIDAIVYDGILSVGDEIVLAGKKGIIRTKVRALLEPKPLNEIRDQKDKFNSVKEVHAAAGVKIAAPNLEDALAGSPLFVVKEGNEEELVKTELDSIKIETDANGPIIRTDALGSLEALVKLLADKGIKPKHADVGDVTRKDIIEAFAVCKAERFKGVVFAFNVKLNPEAESELEKTPVKVFKENVIYKLIEDYSGWVAEEQEKDKKQKFSELTWPAKIKVLPNCIFRHSKPAIVGIRVLDGKLRNEVELMTSKKPVGSIKAIQKDGKSIEEAKKGEEVAISIEGATVGRSFEENDELYTSLNLGQLAKLCAVQNELNEDEKELIEEIKKIMKKIQA